MGEVEFFYLVVVFRDRIFILGLFIMFVKYKDVILVVKEFSVLLLWRVYLVLYKVFGLKLGVKFLDNWIYFGDW